jgi:hypothetical protein
VPEVTASGVDAPTTALPVTTAADEFAGVLVTSKVLIELLETVPKSLVAVTETAMYFPARSLVISKSSFPKELSNEHVAGIELTDVFTGDVQDHQS